MKIVIDENMGSRRLSQLLQAAGHDVALAVEVGLHEVSDARILTWAIGERRPVLTRDHSDFADLHDLTIAAGGTHPGILVVRFDNDPSGCSCESKAWSRRTTTPSERYGMA